MQFFYEFFLCFTACLSAFYYLISFFIKSSVCAVYINSLSPYRGQIFLIFFQADFTREVCIICDSDVSIKSPSGDEEDDKMYASFAISPHPPNRRQITCKCRWNPVSQDFLTSTIKCIGDKSPIGLRMAT